MKNKKLLKGMVFILVAGLIAFGLVGCGGQEEEPAVEEDAYADYPTKSIDAICPWSAGGGSDGAFRGYVRFLAEELGTDINVRNVTGGNGAIGWAEAAAAPADGYNMALLTFDILTNEAMQLTDTSFRDFEIINMFTNQGCVLITHSDYEWETLEDFLDAAREAQDKGEKLTIGVAGENGLWHQAGALMAERTGTEDAFNYIPFQGSADQLADMLGKHIDAMVTSITASIGHIEEGTLNFLAPMSQERVAVFPDVKTFQEHGYDVIYESWRAVVVPAGTPEPIVEKLREAGKIAYDNPEFQEWATDANIDQLYLDAEDTVEYLENQYPAVENIMRRFGLIN